MSNVISVLRRLVFCVSLCALGAVPTLAQAAAVYLQAPNSDSNGQYYASVTSETGFSDGGAATQFAPFGISAATAGNYRTGDWSNAQEANLGTGVMRSSMLYASGGDRSEYELDNYITMLDTLTFHGSGSAVFDLHLTGNFSGGFHRDYANTMRLALDFTSDARNADVAGRINLGNRFAGGEASFMSGTTCSGYHFALGSVSCDVNSLNVSEIDIVLHVLVNDITDGESIRFYSSLNLSVYGPRMGGSDFGHTARLGVAALNGVTFSSESGVFLTDTGNSVPEPSGAALVVLALLGWRFAGRRFAGRPSQPHLVC